MIQRSSRADTAIAPGATRYAIIGGSLWGNRGAEAMISAAIGEVRRQHKPAEFTIYTYHPQEDRRILTDGSITVRDARPFSVLTQMIPAAIVVRVLRKTGVSATFVGDSLRSLVEANAFIDVSGISFSSGRPGVSLYNLLSTLPAKILGIPVIRLSQAFGPFSDFFTRATARLALDGRAFTFTRGEESEAMLRQAVPTATSRVSRADDLALLFRDEDSLTALDQESLKVTLDWMDRPSAGDVSEVVALFPSSLVNRRFRRLGEDYVALLERQVRALCRSGRRVIVVPNATKAGRSTERNNDIVPIGQLRHRLGAERSSDSPPAADVMFVEFDINTAGIRSIIERCEAVITSRFHAMIAALSLGVPVLVLGWSHKYREVLQRFDLHEHAVDAIEAARAGDVESMIQARMTTLSEDRRRIRAFRSVVEQGARKQIADLPELIRMLNSSEKG